MRCALALAILSLTGCQVDAGQGPDLPLPLVAAAGLILLLLGLLFKQRRTAAHRQAQYRHLRGITDNLPGVVYQFFVAADGSYGLNFVSSNAEAIFGLPPDTRTLFDALSARVHPDDQVRFADSIAEAVATVSPWRFEGRYVTPAGKTIWFSGRSTPHRKGGEIIYDGVLMDVTTAKRTARALVESEALLRLFVENTPAAVAMCDGRMNYLAYSRRWIVDYGLPDEDLRGRNHYEVFGVIPERWKEEHQRCLAGEVITKSVEPFPRANGSVDWVNRTLHPWRDENGDIGGLILFTEVVTHKHQALEHQRLMEQVLVDSPAILFRWVPVEGWPVAYVSPSVRRLGYGPDEFMEQGRTYASIIHPDDLKGVVRSVESREHSDERHFQLEYRILTKDGDIRWVNDHTMVEHDDQGRVLHYQGIILDTTKRKRAEEDLRDRQQFLEAVLSHAPDAMIILDENCYITEWNPGAEAIFGYTRDEVLGQNLASLITRDEAGRREVENAGRQILSGQRKEAFETIRYNKDGSPVQVLAAGAPIIIDGTVRAIVGIYTDISQLKEAEKKVARNARMLRRIMDIVPSMIFVRDDQGHYLMANQAVADAYNTTVEALIGRPTLTIHPQPDQARRFLDDDRRALESGHPLFIPEERFEDASGVNRWLEVTKVPCDADDFGRPAVVGLATDITARKHAEEELQKLRNYLSNIINSMPSVLVGVDGNGNVTQWNAQAEQLTGMPFDTVRSRPLDAVFPQMVDEMERIRQAIRERTVLKDPKIARMRDGQLCFEDVTIFPLVSNGVEGAVIRVDDITDRVRMEEMMIQSEKMLSVGGLAAGMAHEINNPLAGIIQNAAVLENRLTGELPANHQAAQQAGTTMEAIHAYLELRHLPTMLENIRASGDRAAAIVKNMLSFARKSDRTMGLHDLGELLDQTIELARTDYDLKKQYDFKKIHIVRHYDENVHPVPCEASKIQQVLLNILKNGAEAMAQGGTARQPPTFALRLANDGPWVRLEMEDNGPGMDQEVCRRIFEPFFTTKAVGRGTGLGLSVSYFIVTENHGGKMDVAAVENGGTRFTIRLPKHR